MVAITRRRVLRLLGLATVVCLLFVGWLPTMLGSRWIYQPLIDQLAADQFQLSIDRVRLRWFSPLQLDGIRVSETNGPSLLSIAKVRTDRSLLGYLLGGRKLGRLEIDQPTISLELLQDGSNLERIVQALDKAAAKPDQPRGAPPAIDIEVVIRDMSAKVSQASGQAPLVIVPPFNVQASYQAASGESHLKLAPTRILDRVTITKELVDLGLGHALPLLAKSAWFDGQVSLDVGAIDVPLNRPKQSSADLKLTLHQVRSGPSDPAILRVLDFIGRVRGREVTHELIFVDGSEVKVHVADGRVQHEGMEFGFPKMDERFQIATSGSVGIEDKSLDLIIRVPVPVEQVARRESVQQLGVPTLKLPITGTLDKPHLNWEAMRGDAASLLGTIKTTLADDAPTTAKVVGAMEGLASGQADETIAAAVDIIAELRQRRRAKQQAEPAADSQTSPGQPLDEATNGSANNSDKSKSNQPVRDAIRDFLKRK